MLDAIAPPPGLPEAILDELPRSHMLIRLFDNGEIDLPSITYAARFIRDHAARNDGAVPRTSSYGETARGSTFDIHSKQQFLARAGRRLDAVYGRLRFCERIQLEAMLIHKLRFNSEEASRLFRVPHGPNARHIIKGIFLAALRHLVAAYVAHDNRPHPSAA